MAINTKRAASFARKSANELKDIIRRGSLSSEAASYALKQNYGITFFYVPADLRGQDYYR